MSYQVARDGQTIGTFTEEELIDAIESGTILITDDAWAEGMKDWVSVQSLVEIEEIDEDEEMALQEEEEPLDAPTILIPKRPQVTPLGKPTASGHPPTSHYGTVAPSAPVHSAPVQVSTPVVTPAFHPPAVVYGAPPPPMMRGEVHNMAGRYGIAGLAIASIVLAIIGLLGGVTAIPAIVCGHRALDKIRRSHGAFSGRGVAITGMILGYLLLAVWVAVLLVKVILPATGKKF